MFPYNTCIIVHVHIMELLQFLIHFRWKENVGPTKRTDFIELNCMSTAIRREIGLNWKSGGEELGERGEENVGISTYQEEGLNLTA